MTERVLYVTKNCLCTSHYCGVAQSSAEIDLKRFPQESLVNAWRVSTRTCSCRQCDFGDGVRMFSSYKSKRKMKTLNLFDGTIHSVSKKK